MGEGRPFGTITLLGDTAFDYISLSHLAAVFLLCPVSSGGQGWGGGGLAVVLNTSLLIHLFFSKGTATKGVILS